MTRFRLRVLHALVSQLMLGEISYETFKGRLKHIKKCNDSTLRDWNNLDTLGWCDGIEEMQFLYSIYLFYINSKSNKENINNFLEIYTSGEPDSVDFCLSERMYVYEGFMDGADYYSTSIPNELAHAYKQLRNTLNEVRAESLKNIKAIQTKKYAN